RIGKRDSKCCSEDHSQSAFCPACILGVAHYYGPIDLTILMSEIGRLLEIQAPVGRSLQGLKEFLNPEFDFAKLLAAVAGLLPPGSKPQRARAALPLPRDAAR